jgi:hypothetical protein
MNNKFKAGNSLKNYAARWSYYSSNPASLLLVRVEDFERWHKAAESLIIGTAPADGLRHRFALALLQTSLEHSVAIRFLIKHCLVASALALYRPQMEGYVRGLWILHCATDAQVDAFRAGKDVIPKLPLLTQALDDALETKRFTEMRLALSRKLNDFTHGGAIQAGQRLQNSVLQSNFDHNDALGLLNASTILAHMARQDLALTNGRTDIVLVLDKLLDDIFPNNGW